MERLTLRIEEAPAAPNTLTPLLALSRVILGSRVILEETL